MTHVSFKPLSVALSPTPSMITRPVYIVVCYFCECDGAVAVIVLGERVLVIELTTRIGDRPVFLGKDSPTLVTLKIIIKLVIIKVK